MERKHRRPYDGKCGAHQRASAANVLCVRACVRKPPLAYVYSNTLAHTNTRTHEHTHNQHTSTHFICISHSHAQLARSLAHSLRRLGRVLGWRFQTDAPQPPTKRFHCCRFFVCAFLRVTAPLTFACYDTFSHVSRKTRWFVAHKARTCRILCPRVHHHQNIGLLLLPASADGREPWAGRHSFSRRAAATHKLASLDDDYVQPSTPSPIFIYDLLAIINKMCTAQRRTHVQKAEISFSRCCIVVRVCSSPTSHHTRTEGKTCRRRVKEVEEEGQKHSK